jgi:cyclic pyranopterin phosphate synthase
MTNCEWSQNPCFPFAIRHPSFEIMDKTRKASKKLTHLDTSGRARMVDVSNKMETSRRAIGESFIRLSHETLHLLLKGKLPKGNALETARLAGIQAAKRTADLIPLCHPLLLTHVNVEAEPGEKGVRFVATVSCKGSTGVEMEALTAASVAALTLYDMVKAVEKGATIGKIQLLEKSGGKSGLYRRRKP